MTKPVLAASLLWQARERAGLSQRELARRAGTAQSVVSRIETGKTEPSVATLEALLAAAGFRLVARLEPVAVVDTHMLDDVARILKLTPEKRLKEVRNVARSTNTARRG
jgi:transcriptional regulator with XRE-family HTH domain